MALTIRNSEYRYGIIAVLLHWLIAFCVIGLYIVGSIMEDMKPSLQQFELYQLHKSFGILVLALTVLRLGWRVANPQPSLPPAMPGWQQLAARTTHWAFYGLLLAVPLAGWAMVSASSLNIPTVLFGLVELPHIGVIASSADKQALEGTFSELHELAANGLLALFIVHVGAALYHHVKLGDSVLLKMLPISRAAFDERLARELNNKG
jgi:cytochrome b561